MFSSTGVFIQDALWREDLQLPAIPQLCTLKLARLLLPNELKKNVGALADIFNIPLKNRHRALGDAKATALILIELLEILETQHDIHTYSELMKFQNSRGVTFKKKSPSFEKLKKQIEILPKSPGIYKYFNHNKDLLYIGKSKDIKSRVMSYFNVSGVKSRKIGELVKQIDHIEFESTESELSALILECRQIKELKPTYNKALKREKKISLY